MKKLKTLTLLVLVVLTTFAFTTHSHSGKYFTRSGHVWFFSHTPMEDIEAHNYKGTSVMDIHSGALEFSVLMTAFTFEKALMQEHFNENYVESEKYPKSKFKGKITNLSDIKFDTDGMYNATVRGDLTIKDVTKQVETTVAFTIKEGKISGKTDFTIEPKTYNIEIPGVVRDKIAKETKVNVEVDYSELNR